MFITVEGLDGCGKTTVVQLLCERLEALGKDVFVTREPGGSHLGRLLRCALLDQTITVSQRAELFLFLADRSEHVARVIRPALARGSLVLCDRYTDSTLAYQGYGRGLPLEELSALNHAATDGLSPDLTLLLDLPLTLARRRVAKRATMQTTEREKRFDAESEAFHERVQRGYHTLLAQEPGRIQLIDAAQPLKTVVQSCLDIILDRITSLGGVHA